MGRGEQRSPVLFAISLAISAQYLCFFTYHVGDGAPDVPFGERRGLNLYIPCRRTKAGERCSPLLLVVRITKVSSGDKVGLSRAPGSLSSQVQQKTSLGDNKSKHNLGRELISSTTLSMSSSDNVLKSVLLGKKNRSTSFMFSFEPRCHGE